MTIHVDLARTPGLDQYEVYVWWHPFGADHSMCLTQSGKWVPQDYFPHSRQHPTMVMPGPSAVAMKNLIDVGVFNPVKPTRWRAWRDKRKVERINTGWVDYATGYHG